MPKYRKLLEKYEIYLATVGWNLKNFGEEVFDIGINFIDVNDGRNKFFLELLNQLDGMAYGEKGIPMDKWVSYDMAMLPSAIVGFCSYSNDLPNVVRDKFNDYQKANGLGITNFSDYDGLMPVSEYCAIPTANKDVWVGHTLAVWNGSGGNQDKGLGTLTKTIAMAVYEPKYLIGIAQYDNFSLRVHSKFDDLEILSAITYPHSMPEMTFTYRTKIPKKRKLVKILAEESSGHLDDVTFFLDPYDLNSKQLMHAKLLEGSSRYWIVKPGLISKDGIFKVPVEESKSV